MADELDKIKQIVNGNQSNVNAQFNTATGGLNLDSSLNQIPKGTLTYALNATLENFDETSINYQNEQGNEHCLNFPDGYQVIADHSIFERNKHIFFLANPTLGDSEIGYMNNNDCLYQTLVNSKCLNFSVNHPIHKIVHRITNCGTEIYWPDQNARRYLDIDNIPYIQSSTSEPCDLKYTQELDCNAINIQPDFPIPQLEVVDVNIGGDLLAGTYQFAIQYADVNGGGYSSYYSVTNPTPIADAQITTPNFNYNVGKSINLSISNLDPTGKWKYFNLAVIKTVNAITSVELVGTYFIDDSQTVIIYTGQNVSAIRLTQDDIFEKFPYYEIANDITAVRDVLVWDNLTSIDRINYQHIANQITLQWETYRIPNTETYADELNATNLRGYMRDEVYAFEVVFLLTNGKQTDGFHIPGRVSNANDLVPVFPTNADFIGEPDPITGSSPYWKIYNTATLEDFSQGYSSNTDYKGPYQHGDFSYWESVETYPCNKEVWGELANTPIRHHKFPDVAVSPIFESALYSNPSELVMQKDAIYPIGVRIDISQITSLISSSNLTADQKSQIAGFKIVRGDRGTNKSIVAKGILRNVGQYNREGTTYYYPNYPYNDLRQDSFLLNNSNSYTANSNIAGNIACRNFTVQVTALDATLNIFEVEYIDCYTNTITKKTSTTVGETLSICTLSFPAPAVIYGTACVTANTYKIYELNNFSWPTNVYVTITPPETICDGNFAPQEDFVFGGRIKNVKSTSYPIVEDGNPNFSIKEVGSVGYDICNPTNLNGFSNDDSKYRQVFNSPETSFGQPFLGDILKLENVIFGAGRAHFVQVKRNALQRLITKEAQQDALDSADDIANITLPDYNASALFAAYQAYLTIYVNGITRRNYGYSFNSIASYDYSDIINNAAIGTDGTIGIKQRKIDLAQYLIPGVQSAGDNNNINNYQRESSVYIKTSNDVSNYNKIYHVYRICNTNLITNNQTFQYTNLAGVVSTTPVISAGTCLNVSSFTFPTILTGNNSFTITSISNSTTTVSIPTPPLPYPDKTPSIAPSGTSIISDNSRFVLSDDEGDCNNPENNVAINVISYYASLKNTFVNQWGQIYSYDTIDTGFQRTLTPVTSPLFDTVFGGDTFIGKFAFKTKLPFFIDNRVGAPDDSDIYYDEIGNVAYPKYWFSSRSVLSDALVNDINLTNFISVKAHNLDCPNSQTPKTNPGRTFYDGKMYLFAYGIPYFYCESGYNLDLRQAFNNREGDFWPHVSTNIPDEWVQETYVSIANDNTYYYNTTFSKQNRENFFSHLPVDWTPDICFTYFPFRAIYSDAETDSSIVNDRYNNWLVYRPISYFDFPQNYGKLTSLDGIQNKAVLARFENKSLLYNTLLTIDTSNPQAAYVGNNKLFQSAPAIDFAETDLGYVGSQHKLLLKLPQGQLTIDAKRGQVFLITGNQASDLSAFGSGVNKFFTNHLAFEILKYFPNVNVDNHFNGLGLHGVFDSRYDRIIITKLDYIPNSKDIIYDEVDKKFYLIKSLIPGQETREEVYLTDLDYFCNKSWTISYSLNRGVWVSFHSYIPNFYIAENNFFYSGLNDCCSEIEAIVAEVLPEPSTTTTTSSSTTTTSSTSTTTTTTTAFTGCDVEGEAVELYCDLLGEAVELAAFNYCIGDWFSVTNCCEAIAAHNNWCPSIPGSSDTLWSDCNPLAIGCKIYEDAQLNFLFDWGRWIYDGTSCWLVDTSGTIVEEGSCTTTTTTTSPL